MDNSIDSLNIQIAADTKKAANSIDSLMNKVNRLNSSFSVFVSTASGYSAVMKKMSDVKVPDISSFTKNLTKLNNIDISKLSNISTTINHIGKAFQGLEGLSKSSEQLTLIANGIKQLGYKSADKAIANIPLLADAVKKMMQELSTAPKVSRNLIDMTNALAKLARTGASSGKAATSISKAFDGIYRSSGKASLGITNLSGKFKSLFRRIMPFIGVWQMLSFAKQAVDISSDLTEVQNVVDVTFGNFKSKIEDLASVSIQELGMSELTTKQIASRFQAMGTSIGIAQGNMADMSVELTRLAGDMASFYNVEQKAVGEDLESIFTGQTKPLRQYGLDLTEATLQEWAMKQGMDANINSMSQMEKTMLRYQYVMANTGAAQGDFLRTQDTWANQVRILKENFRELASVIGSSFINALKPLVRALNSAMGAIISFAKVVSNALGKIFGWKYEDATGGIASDFEDAAEGADGLASGTGRAADNAKKLKQQLQGIDELNVLSSNNDTGTGGGSGGSGGASGGADASGGQWVQTDGLLQNYESQLDTLFKLGEHIGQTLTDAMNSIDWNRVYEGARNFGSGLASFLNGLISPELFGATGRTIAGALNTALYALNSFGTTFDWKDFGNSIATGINDFFKTFDFKNAADTINTWIKGTLSTVSTLLTKTDFEAIGKKIGVFLKELDFSEISADMANVIWEAIKNAFSLVKGLFKEAPLEASLLSAFSILKFAGIGDLVATKIGTSIKTALSSSAVTTTLSGAVSSIGAILTTAFTTDLPLLFGAGTFAECGVAIFGGLVGAIAAAVGGWTLGTWLYENDILGVQFMADRFIAASGLGDFANSLVSAFEGDFSNAFDALGISLTKGLMNMIPGGLLINTIFPEGVNNAAANFKTSAESALAGLIAGVDSKTTGLKTKLGEMGKSFSDAWTKIKGTFSAGTVKGFFTGVWSNITTPFRGKTGTAVGDFFKSKFSDALTKIKSVFSYSSMQSHFTNVRNGVLNGLGNVATISSKFTSAWNAVKSTWSNSNVINLFTNVHRSVLAPLNTLGDNLKQKFTSAWNKVRNVFTGNIAGGVTDTITKNLKEAVNRLVRGFNTILSNTESLLRTFRDKLKKIPAIGRILGNWSINLPRIPYLANGGMLDGKGQLFVAREKGPELVTSYGNKTAVMNNNQIVESVSGGVEIAVRNANTEQIALLRQQNELLYEILQKETGISYKEVFDATRKANSEFKAMHGHSALA